MKPYWLQDYEKDVRGNKLLLRVVSSVLRRLNLKRITTGKTKDGNMIPDDPLDRARILEEKIRRALSSINLELETVSVNLDEEHNDTLSLRIRILPEAIMTPDEVKVDTDFQQIIKGFKDEGTVT
jgi:hypothetical protein